MPSTSTTQLDAEPRWASWLTGKPGIVMAFFWGFAESTLFFILPDVPLSLAAMFRPRRALMQVAAIVAGAVLGGALMFSWSVRGLAARNAVGKVPLVTPAMFVRAEKDYRDFGAWAVAMGPVRGIPYKVYAVEAPEHGGWFSFLLITIPARAWRLFAVWMGFAGVGMILRRVGRGSLKPVIHGLFWIVVYVVYWTKVK